MSRRRVAVIGAGAAGSMAALFAAAAGAEVFLLEKNKECGRKILISGGGRCNVLPARLDERRFVSEASPNLVRKILRAWPLTQQIDFFETELGIPLVEEPATDKLFPRSQRAREVRDVLLSKAIENGMTLLTQIEVIACNPTTAGWQVLGQDGSLNLEVDAVILATGGLSVPTTGSDGFGLRLAAELGHSIHPTYPALTPLLAAESPFLPLSGISLQVTIFAQDEQRAATASARGGFLFTHRGYSGPTVLNVSHIPVRSLAPGSARLHVQWTEWGEAEWDHRFRPTTALAGKTVGSILKLQLPERLGQVLAAQAGVAWHLPVADLRRAARKRLVETLVRGELPWTGDEGYKKAEVTGGGVSLSAIDSRTMQSRHHPGLFFCGEVLDVFGPIGGYNFFWAWVTGRVAGLAAAKTI